MRPVLLALFVLAFCGAAAAQDEEPATFSMDGSDPTQSPIESATLEAIRLSPQKFEGRTLVLRPLWFDPQIYNSQGGLRYVQPRTGPGREPIEPIDAETHFIVSDEMAARILSESKKNWPHGAEITLQIYKITQSSKTIWFAAITRIGILGDDGQVARTIESPAVRVPGDKPRSNDLVAVTLEVTGSAAVADITYTAEGGAKKEIERADIPWSVSFLAPPGTRLSIYAQNQTRSGTLTAVIQVAGRPVDASTTDAGFGVAHVYAQIP